MIEDLRNHVCEVTFTKADGSERVMTCTLHPDFLPKPDMEAPSISGDSIPSKMLDLITVWDVEADGWRSIKPFKVTNFKALTE